MKSSKLKKLIAVTVATLTLTVLSPIGASAEWKQDSNGWWNTEGNSYSVGWKSINGSWYYFNTDGYMKTGWVNDGGTWYYLQSSGAMKAGWVNDGGTWYYLQSSGAMKTGWVNDRGTWYYLQPSGAMKTGWINDGGTWYFAASSGAMQTGVIEVDGKVYYLAASGAMATGNVNINGVAYNFDASGAAVGDKIPTPDKAFNSNGIEVASSKPAEGDNGSGGTSSGGGGGSSNALSNLSDGKSHTGNYKISNEGTFGSSDSSKVTTINGNISIADAGALAGNTITLQNLKINGTLTVDFGAGNVILDNVIVDGVNVSNVGSNSLYVRGDSSIGDLEVNDKNNDAHIVVEGNASITSATILSGAQLQVASDAKNANPFANVTLSPKSSDDKVTLTGKFNDVIVDKPSNVVVSADTTVDSIAANSDLTLSGAGQVNNVKVEKAGANVSLEVPSIGTVFVNSSATGSKIDIPAGTTVKTLNANANVGVKGAGTIKTANLGVSGITIETKPENVAVVPGVTVTIANEKIDANSPGVTIIDKVPTDPTDPTPVVSEFQNDINDKYMKYRDFTVNSNSSNGLVTFNVVFDEEVNNSETGNDYVTQDVFVTNADGTDEGIEYNDGQYTAKSGAKVYTVVRVYRDGQVGYVTSDPMTVN